MSKLQKKPAAHKRGHPTLQNMNFKNFFYFCGSFLPSWIRIRSHWPDWIRIESGSGSETLFATYGTTSCFGSLKEVLFIYSVFLCNWPSLGKSSKFLLGTWASSKFQYIPSSTLTHKVTVKYRIVSACVIRLIETDGKVSLGFKAKRKSENERK